MHYVGIVFKGLSKAVVLPLQKQWFCWSKAVLFKYPYDPHSCYRSFIEMIAKISTLGKLGKAKAQAKRGDLGVKTQAVLRLKVSCFEGQSNLSCETK